MSQDSINKKSAKKETLTDTDMKTRIMLKVTPTHPFGKFQSSLKERSIKITDMASLLSEALNEVPQTWWENKIEELTPLEFRVSEALSNPLLREKLSKLLEKDSSLEG
tara:strand:- start:159 stop:482 length:324 start_codon:yes stop_codon:yes gene_type:complete